MDQRLGGPVRSRPAAPSRRLRLSPSLFILGLAVVGSVVFLAYALTVRDPSQIPLLSAGAAVMGLVFTALTVAFAAATFRAGRDGRAGYALLLALCGGVAAIVACGAFAGAVILALVLGA